MSMRAVVRWLWLFCGVTVALPGCDQFGQARGLDLERMIEQPRYDPYEVGPEFPDDRVLQRPPEGTVPRERLVGDPALTRGVGPDGEPLAEIPVPVTPELLALGRKNFQIYCAACHGAGGYGGSLVAANMQPPRPPSLVTGHGAEHAPGYYYGIITHGQDRMPPYAAELSVPERWAVVAYLTRVLQRPHPLSPAEREDSARAAWIQQTRPAPPETERAHRHGHADHEHGAQDQTGTGEPQGESAAGQPGHEHQHQHQHQHGSGTGAGGIR